MIRGFSSAKITIERYQIFQLHNYIINHVNIHVAKNNNRWYNIQPKVRERLIITFETMRDPITIKLKLQYFSYQFFILTRIIIAFPVNSFG